LEDLFTIEEAAAKLTLSPWTLRKWIAAGELRVIRLGRRIVVPESAIRELIERCKAQQEAA